VTGCHMLIENKLMLIFVPCIFVFVEKYTMYVKEPVNNNIFLICEVV